MYSRLRCSASEAQASVTDSILVLDGLILCIFFFWFWFGLCGINDPLKGVCFLSWKRSCWHKDKSNLFGPSPPTSFLLWAFVCSSLWHSSAHDEFALECKITHYQWFVISVYKDHIMHELLIADSFDSLTMCVNTTDFKHIVKACRKDRVYLLHLECLWGLWKAMQCLFYQRLSINDSSSESLWSWDWMCKVNQIVTSGSFPTICIWLLLHLTEYLLFHMSCLHFNESTTVIRIKSKYVFEMSAPEHCLDMFPSSLPNCFQRIQFSFLTMLADQGTCFIGWERLWLYKTTSITSPHLTACSQSLGLPFVWLWAKKK